MSHDDLHGLRRERDPHTPRPYKPENENNPDWLLIGLAVLMVIFAALLLL